MWIPIASAFIAGTRVERSTLKTRCTPSLLAHVTIQVVPDLWLRCALTLNLTIVGQQVPQSSYAASSQALSLNDWQAFGEFVHRIRQSRRLLRIEFENRSIRLRKHGFYPRKAAWRKKGLAVCRHGLFFNAPSAGFQCPCSGQPAHSDALWQKAVLMPIIDEDLRSIIAVPFVAGR